MLEDDLCQVGMMAQATSEPSIDIKFNTICPLEPRVLRQLEQIPFSHTHTHTPPIETIDVVFHSRSLAMAIGTYCGACLGKTIGILNLFSCI